MAGPHDESAVKTLSLLSAEYLEWRRSLKISEQTFQVVAYRLKGFLAWLERTSRVQTAEGLRRSHLEAWQKHIAGLTNREGHPVKARSLNNNIAAVKGLLAYLGQHGYVGSTLHQALSYVKAPKVLPGAVLSHAQVRKLLTRVRTHTATGYRNRAMIELLYSAGIRCGELLGLNIEDIDFKNGVAMVTGKGGKQRMVPIGKTAMRYLQSYSTAVRPFLLRNRTERAAFLTSEGKRVTPHIFRAALHAAAARAGLDVTVTPHTMRRSCTTELIRSGANMYHVKELLGHESLDTLRHYAKLTIVDLKKTHEKCHPREREDR